MGMLMNRLIAAARTFAAKALVVFVYVAVAAAAAAVIGAAVCPPISDIEGVPVRISIVDLWSATPWWHAAQTRSLAQQFVDFTVDIDAVGIVEQTANRCVVLFWVVALAIPVAIYLVVRYSNSEKSFSLFSYFVFLYVFPGSLVVMTYLSISEWDYVSVSPQIHTYSDCGSLDTCHEKRRADRWRELSK
jgi:hypothetical protein